MEMLNLVLKNPPMMYSGGLERIGFVRGVGATPSNQPQGLSHDAAYFTDGLRAVLFFATRPLTLSSVHVLDWERPLADRASVESQEPLHATQE